MSSSSHSSPLSGTRHGSYILGDRVAAGGMAEVFTARPVGRHFDAPIVIKRMLPHLATDRAFVAMFIDEARLSTRLDHPNIVKVHEFEATHRGLSLIMELVDGPDLLAVIKRVRKRGGHIPIELAVYITCHVLEALDYAHNATFNGKSLGVVHRDVSPSNILLTRRGRVKLADFGIARASDRQQETGSGTLKGKYGYMSPEQILGHAVDGRSDLFSTAIVLAEMLMGRRLFSAPGDLEVLLMVRRAELTRYDKHATHVPAALDQVIRKALSCDPELRYANAAQLRDALSDWLADSQHRTSAAQLGDYLRRLEREAGNLCKWRRKSPPSTGSNTISGPETRIARVQLKKAAVAGRKMFALGGSVSHELPVATKVDDLTFEQDRARDPNALHLPTRSGQWAIDSGNLTDVHPLDLLCDIGGKRRTGLLTLTCSGKIKELYFRDGDPEFVRSNVLSDRFGQFLVSRGVLTPRELDRVLATLPHFDGRIGQALVALKILKPVDAVRLLAQQVEHKIVDACSWRSGRYTFREGVRNPWPALSLALKTLEIVARARTTLSDELLGAWVNRHSGDMPAVDVAALEQFQFDKRTARLMEVFLGKRSLQVVLAALPESVERQQFLSAAYVLARCKAMNYAALTAPPAERC